MKVNPTGPPMTGGTEPVEPSEVKQLQEAARGDTFAAQLAQLEAQMSAGQTPSATGVTRFALTQIAMSADLSTSEGAASAVRESARFMIRSRLGRKLEGTEQGRHLVEGMSAYVASDPLLKEKLLNILHRVKTA